MPRHVIVSKNPNLEIGKVYQGLETDPWNIKRPEQHYLIVGHSDELGWIECLVAIQGEGMRDHHEMMAKLDGPWYYYEIETD